MSKTVAIKTETVERASLRPYKGLTLEMVLLLYREGHAGILGDHIVTLQGKPLARLVRRREMNSGAEITQVSK